MTGWARASAAGSIAASARLSDKPRYRLIGSDTALIVVDWDLEAMLPDEGGRPPFVDGSWLFAILDCQDAVGSAGWSLDDISSSRAIRSAPSPWTRGTGTRTGEK